MKNLAQKMLKVMRSVNGLTHDAYNADGKYPYVSVAKVIDSVNKALTENGIVTYTDSKIVGQELMVDKIYFAVEVKVTLLDIDSGETLTLTGVGAGIGDDDKVLARAQTMGLKYAFKCGFLMADASDDPDSPRSKGLPADVGFKSKGLPDDVGSFVVPF